MSVSLSVTVCERGGHLTILCIENCNNPYCMSGGINITLARPVVRDRVSVPLVSGLSLRRSESRLRREGLSERDRDSVRP